MSGQGLPIIIIVLGAFLLLSRISPSGVQPDIYTPAEKRNVFETVARNVSLPWWILEAIAIQESGLRSDLVVLDTNGRYSYGLMQIQFETAQDIGYNGTREELTNVFTNVLWGAKYLKDRQSKYLTKVGSLFWAVAAYNAGTPVVVDDSTEPPKFKNQDYVDAVMKNVRELQSNAEVYDMEEGV